MRARSVSAIVAYAIATTVGSAQAFAEVDLELRPSAQTVDVGADVSVGIYAVSNDGTNQEFSGLDVVLSWDPATLELAEVVNDGPQIWTFVYGFLSDSMADGLNNSFLDGDALFQASTFCGGAAPEPCPRASAEGLLLGTLKFKARLDSPKSPLNIERSLGVFSNSQVLQPGAINVTGVLGTADITTLADARLSVTDVNLAPGGVANAVVFGEIDAQDTFGVTVLLELVPRGGNTGSAFFTPAASPAEVDIVQLGDPWPGIGSFSAFDTGLIGSTAKNGAVLDNGTFFPAPTTYVGDLFGFRVTTSSDASGIWDIKMCESPCTQGNAFSIWDPLDGPLTGLRFGVLTVVQPGDGNADGAVAIGDFADFQACFTGDSGTPGTTVYSLEPQQRCGAYDFDADGDVDVNDFAAFRAVISGPN